jgi:hypothetical protein
LTIAVLLAAPAEQRCDTSTKPAAEYLESMKAAVKALRDQHYVDALTQTAQARAFATVPYQMVAILDVEIHVHNALKDTPQMISAIERSLAYGCLPALVRKNYEQVLERERG